MFIILFSLWLKICIVSLFVQLNRVNFKNVVWIYLANITIVIKYTNNQIYKKLLNIKFKKTKTKIIDNGFYEQNSYSILINLQNLSTISNKLKYFDLISYLKCSKLTITLNQLLFKLYQCESFNNAKNQDLPNLLNCNLSKSATIKDSQLYVFIKF